MTMNATTVSGPGGTGPASLKAQQMRMHERDGYAVMAAATAFGEAAEHGSLSGIAHAAQLFCILCGFFLPVIALWNHTM